MNWNESLDLIDQLLRSGQLESAAKKILTLTSLNPPADCRPRLACAAGDVGLASLGLRLLAEAFSQPNQELLLIQAKLLGHAGAYPDALRLLEQLPQIQEVRSTRAAVLLDCRRDGAAEKEAREALQMWPQDPSLILTLAQSLIRQRREFEAESYIEAALEISTNQKLDLIRARALALKIETYLLQKRFSDVPALIQTLATALSPIDTFTPQKWRRILFAVSSSDLTPIESLRTECLEHKDLEGLRQCDLYALRIEFNKDRFHRLYFGTIAPEFRAQMEKEFDYRPDVREFLLGAMGAPQLDLVTGVIEGSTLTELPPKLIHSILSALTRDLYHPVSAGAIFAEVFPNENFDVHTSVHRVHQAIHRTRRWLAAQQIPVQIHEFKGRYTLTVDGFFAIRIPLELQTSDNEHRRMYALAKFFGERGFTARQARQALGLSPAIFKSLMTWAEKQGHVTRFGAGPSTKYKINAA